MANLKGSVVLCLLVFLFSSAANGQSGDLTRADSQLVGRILAAEEARDSTAPALAEGTRHPDSRIRSIARRATWRIRDSLFANRDSLDAMTPPVHWDEPAWRLRYRELTAKRDDCRALNAALADSTWQVRLRALDLVRTTCAADDSLMATIRRWADALPAGVSSRSSGGISWHAAAHAFVALARLQPVQAQSRMKRFASHPEWRVRMYAARAASSLADTARLRALAVDSNDNVKEAAIDGLSALVGHAADDIYLQVLAGKGAQAVRAAAVALKDSPRAGVKAAANAAFERWVAGANASSRDVRMALLEAAGRPASDDRRPPPATTIPAEAVPLALGKRVDLLVRMASRSGGGSFRVRLRGDVAPIMAARILDLARHGYYHHLTWQRVEPDFVIQGGSPGDNEYVGYKQFLRDELGTLPHNRGTVGMSTRGHDTGDAQWFINLKDNPRLGRDYTVFAEVIEGMEVVDGVLEGDMIESMTEVR
jgi:cyclophilin family peptidyl-prolyl cis-trans isomerase